MTLRRRRARTVVRNTTSLVTALSLSVSPDYTVGGVTIGTAGIAGCLKSGFTALLQRDCDLEYWGFAPTPLHGEYAPSFDTLSRYARDPDTDYQKNLRDPARPQVGNHFPWPLSERQLERVRLLGEGEGQERLPKELRVAGGYGGAYRRMHSSTQALTLTTWMFHPGSGMFTHPKDNRVVTVREGARLQSFQDNFRFKGRYHSQCRQLGNAVAPLVAHQLALSIAGCLGIPANPSKDEYGGAGNS